jgi:hypothetical protein
MTIVYQKDFKVTVPTATQKKVTLSLNHHGDLELVEGTQKLAEQLMRAIVNDAMLDQGLAVNSVSLSPRYVETLFNIVLRNFRQAQINETKKIDASFDGYAIYRFGGYFRTSTFDKVSPDPVTTSFTDTGLANGFTYTYGISMIYHNAIAESPILEKINVMPTQFENKRETVIGQNFVAIPGNKSVTFYVDYNKYYKKSELLESIISIDAIQSATEPRNYKVDVKVKNLDGNTIDMASDSYKPT